MNARRFILFLFIAGAVLGASQYYFVRSEIVKTQVISPSSVPEGFEDIDLSLLPEVDYCAGSRCYNQKVVEKVGFPLSAEIEKRSDVGPFKRYGGVGVKMTLSTNLFIFLLGLPATGYIILLLFFKETLKVD